MLVLHLLVLVLLVLQVLLLVGVQRGIPAVPSGGIVALGMALALCLLLLLVQPLALALSLSLRSSGGSAGLQLPLLRVLRVP